MTSDNFCESSLKSWKREYRFHEHKNQLKLIECPNTLNLCQNRLCIDLLLSTIFFQSWWRTHHVFCAQRKVWNNCSLYAHALVSCLSGRRALYLTSRSSVHGFFLVWMSEVVFVISNESCLSFFDIFFRRSLGSFWHLWTWISADIFTYVIVSLCK